MKTLRQQRTMQNSGAAILFRPIAAVFPTRPEPFCENRMQSDEKAAAHAAYLQDAVLFFYYLILILYYYNYNKKIV
ncbi:MAG: hypothetical protein IKD72_10150 [Clostridia bacterium]|nr:hypothetical protein [Clostridia bacterium]